MTTLRLFHESDRDRQIDSYIMGPGDVTIGRDPEAVWVIDDPGRRLSRFHCTVSVRDEAVFVRDTSANGVFIGAECARLEPSVDIQVAGGTSLQLGEFVLVVDQRMHFVETEGSAESHTSSAPLADDSQLLTTRAIQRDWSEPEAPPVVPVARSHAAVPSDVIMLEAFCEGARLDPSYLASEDSAEVMRRLGQIYQQLVLGLGDLMSARASVKSEYSLERTTIGPTANNPMKWAPTQRLAIDLLCEGNGGFLSGADAIKECFEDLKGHSLALVAGSRAAVSSLIDQFDPATIEADVKMKTPLFMERSEASWRRLKSVHADISSNPFNDAESVVNVAFRRGYELRTAELSIGDTEE